MNGKYLTERERYELETYLKLGMHKKDIANRMNICLATVYNEINRGTVEFRNSDYTTRKEYCADRGQAVTRENQSYKGACQKAKYNKELLAYIGDMILNQKYSPYAVSVMLEKNKDKFGVTLCETSIYNYVYRGMIPNVKRSSLPYEKSALKTRSARSRIALNNIHGQSIEKRPKDVNERTNEGHWEMDTVVGGKKKSKQCLLVLTERKFRTEEIYRMKDKCAQTTVDVLDAIEKEIGTDAFRKKYLTITSDNGVEFLNSDGIVNSCNDGQPRTDYYYCHPYCSSERGSNENNNKLIRRWIPKGSDIADYTDEEIKHVMEWCNTYPRKMFGGLSSEQARNKLS